MIFLSYLEKINTPKDLKRLNVFELSKLATEIRLFLIEKISHTGGHLASNLGVVELTLALHYVFNCPIDKFIWDVGHQSYVHKILTGRKNKFDSLRQYHGMSGFPKTHESIYDCFDVGHSSTSISAALGFCISRDLNNEKYSVISIIGDGSMTGGLAYEALNNAGKKNTNIIVILNDNQMSISENVGALSKHLSDLRSQPLYLNTKEDINNMLEKIPLVGDNLKKLIGKTKGSIKYFIYPNIIFEQLGFKYIGPIDGHNIEKLIQVLSSSKKMSGPILIHVKTIKGKGYEKAENAPTKFHGTEAFDIDTGLALQTKIWDSYSDVFGKTILKLATENKKIIAITAAMPNGVGLSQFKEKYPKRVIDVGIAEEHAVTFAAGIAKNNFIPVVAIYSSFLQRAYDQILHDVCIQNLHVIFAIDRSGIVGSDGETHQGLFDISFLSHIPNMTIMAPKNKFEMISMIEFAVDYSGPIAIRYPRGSASRILRQFNEKIILGKSEIINSGEKFVLVSFGSMADEMLEVFTKFKNENINPGFINARFAKPIDKETIVELNKYDYVFTAEENVKSGGFSQNLSASAKELNLPIKNLFAFALPDEFVEQGTRPELLLKYKMDPENIYCRIKKIMSGDNKND